MAFSICAPNSFSSSSCLQRQVSHSNSCPNLGNRLKQQKTFLGSCGSGFPKLSGGFNAKQTLSWRMSNKRCQHITLMSISIPMVPYRTPGEGTLQLVELWQALYQERVIFIGEEITEESSNEMLATMLYLDTVDSSRKLTLFIHCPGGDLTPSLAIYDAMQSLKSGIATRVIGYATNMAAFIAAAGDKGDRAGTPHCRIAFQPPAGKARGQADNMNNEAKELIRIGDYLCNELAKKTGQPLERVKNDLSQLTSFDAREAVEYGIIDKILRPPPMKI